MKILTHIAHNFTRPIEIPPSWALHHPFIAVAVAAVAATLAVIIYRRER
jgi:hypothetical protein